MRQVRTGPLRLAVPVVGIALVIGSVLFVDTLRVQLILVIVGLLLVEAGVWRLAAPFLPDDRRYLALRTEGDHFITLIRQLNSAAVEHRETGDPGAALALDEIKTEMHRSVDRMARFAGKPGEAVEDEAAPEVAPADAPSGTTPGY